MKTSSSEISAVLDPHTAFQFLRYRIEEAGTYVFTERVNDASFKGFCFERDRNFFLFVNSTRQSARTRIFTAIHELAHLMCKQEGIVDVSRQRLKIERYCNAVTANYLLPADNFLETLERLGLSPSLAPTTIVNRLAGALPFSKFFLAIRLQEVDRGFRGFASSWLRAVKLSIPESEADPEELRDFEAGLNELDTDAEDKDAIRRQGTGGYHSARLGFNAVKLASLARKQDIVSVFDLEEALSIPARAFDKVVESNDRRIKEVHRGAP